MQPSYEPVSLCQMAALSEVALGRCEPIPLSTRKNGIETVGGAG